MQHSKLFIALAMGASLASCGGGNSGGSSSTEDNSLSKVAFVSCSSDTVCTLSGTINEDYTLTAGVQWNLDGTVLVGSGNTELTTEAEVQSVVDAGVTLTIEPGVDVRALPTGSLVVTRGSKLMAEGTAAEPITFSSLSDDDFDGLGEWGGVIIQGFAPQYGPGGTGACFGTGTICNVKGEGGEDVAYYGGNVEDDNSGVIKYVRIAEGGQIAGVDDEKNGLTLQGVGYGTVIDYVQVHNNLDDGVEWFGGTVNATHLVLTGNDDDDVDFDEGYQGNIQHVLIQKNQIKTEPNGSNDPRGIEANSSDDEFVEETHAALANITIIGGPMNNNAEHSKGQQPGMRLRGAVTVSIYNTAVESFDTGCIRIDDADTDGVDGVDKYSDVSLTNVVGFCKDGFYDKRDADSEDNIFEAGFSYSSTFAIQEDFAQLAETTVMTPIVNGSGFEFDATDYIGAVDPNETEGWWEGWTIPGSVVSEEIDDSPSFVSCDDSSCTLSGSVDQDYTIKTGVRWFLDGSVSVGNGAINLETDADVAAVKAAGVTLTIEPGVHIEALPSGALIVTRGSKLLAEGTAASPITFSSVDDDYDGLGEWGGVILQGFAPQYGPGGTGACYGSGTVCNVKGEGGEDVQSYGGNEPDDNSGIIKYVRIAEGGQVAGIDDEKNGLTLQGVGHGTVIDYVQVHNNLDDGIEWFGGTVNATHLVLTGNDDDDIDFDEGFQGNIQFAIIKKDQVKTSPNGSNDPRGIEANSSDDEYVPETNSALANILIIGGPMNNNAEHVKGQQPGMRLRGAVTATITNTAVNGFDTGCVRIDDADTDGVDGVDEFSNVVLTNVFGDCADGFYDKREGDTGTTNATALAFTLDGAYALTDSEAQLDAATTITAVDNGSGFVFEDTDYVGAVAPGTDAADAWWADWTIQGSL